VGVGVGALMEDVVVSVPVTLDAPSAYTPGDEVGVIDDDDSVESLLDLMTGDDVSELDAVFAAAADDVAADRFTRAADELAINSGLARALDDAVALLRVDIMIDELMMCHLTIVSE
jgi:hypothetical protein